MTYEIVYKSAHFLAENVYEQGELIYRISHLFNDDGFPVQTVRVYRGGNIHIDTFRW